MWTLVFIVFMQEEMVASAVGNYPTMYQCFSDREQLAVTAGGSDGHYPPGMQAICVYRGDDE